MKNRSEPYSRRSYGLLFRSLTIRYNRTIIDGTPSMMAYQPNKNFALAPNETKKVINAIVKTFNPIKYLSLNDISSPFVLSP